MIIIRPWYIYNILYKIYAGIYVCVYHTYMTYKWTYSGIVPTVAIVYTCAGSVVLSQTHPAAPYLCRTGNITLRCQYDGVENVSVVLWSIGTEAGTTNPSTIPGHTALPRTTTYQEVVVDSYTNLRERYQCAVALINGTLQASNDYETQIECKHKVAQKYQWYIYIYGCVLE